MKISYVQIVKTDMQILNEFMHTYLKKKMGYSKSTKNIMKCNKFEQTININKVLQLTVQSLSNCWTSIQEYE